MTQNGLKWFKLVQSDFKSLKMAQIAQAGSNLFKEVQNGSNWFKMAQNETETLKMNQID